MQHVRVTPADSYFARIVRRIPLVTSAFIYTLVFTSIVIVHSLMVSWVRVRKNDDKICQDTNIFHELCSVHATFHWRLGYSDAYQNLSEEKSDLKKFWKKFCWWLINYCILISSKYMFFKKIILTLAIFMTIIRLFTIFGKFWRRTFGSNLNLNSITFPDFRIKLILYPLPWIIWCS